MSKVVTRVTKKPVSQKQLIAPVKRIACPKCGELQLKIYPWASFQFPEGGTIPNCKKCINSTLKSGVA